ncbi:hypothetical protein DIPPA_27474 [Diplonema papillatum]|nr:hypothetical protein DIPPA_27474 [Diplonema papillatum]
MMKRLAALAVFVVAATADRSACVSEETVSFCMNFGDDWMGTSLSECLSGLEPNTTSGTSINTQLSVKIRVLGKEKDLFTSAVQMVELACVSNEAVFSVTNVLSPSLIGLPDFISTVDMEVDLKIVQVPSGDLAMEWKGSIVSGSIDAIFLDFAIKKIGYTDDLITALAIMPPVSQTAPTLPPLIEFSGEPFALFEGVETCPVTKLVPARPNDSAFFAPSLGVPGTEAPIDIIDVFFDPCAALKRTELNCTEQPAICKSEILVLSLTASIANNTQGRTFVYGGVELTDLSISIDGYFVGQGEDENDIVNGDLNLVEDADEAAIDIDPNSLEWEGTVLASVTLFDAVTGRLEGSFSSETGIGNVVLLVQFATSSIEANGSVAWTSDCSPSDVPNMVPLTYPNTGVITVLFSALNASVEATATQVTCEKWSLTGKLLGDSFNLYGVAVESAFVDLLMSPSSGLTGTVQGSVVVASLVQASAAATFAEGELRALMVSGSIDLESVLQGKVSFTVDETEFMRGTGEVTFDLANGALPKLSAGLAYRKNTTVGESMWEVSASMETWELYGIELTEVVAEFKGVLGPNDDLVWTGDVSGKVRLNENVFSVSVSVVDNEFQAIRGFASIRAGGVEFDGAFELDETSKNPNCSGISYTALGDLKASRFVFNGTLTANGCAAPGDLAYAITGALHPDRSSTFGKLTLNRVLFNVTAIAGSKREGNVWSGMLRANANLFGGTSTVYISFQDGAFSDAWLSTYFRTETQLIAGSLHLKYTPNCKEFSKGEAKLLINLAGASQINILGDLDYNVCSGELKFEGNVQGKWTAPKSTKSYGSVSISLFIAANETETSMPIGKRTWEGMLKAEMGIGQDSESTFMTVLNSKTTEVEVSAAISYANDFLVLTAEASSSSTGDCAGVGTIAIQNLPHGLPSVEGSVAVSVADCFAHNNAWSVTGQLDDLTIPFHSKTVTIDSVTVEVKKEGSDSVSVVISGIFAGRFFLAIEFDASDISTLRVVGGYSKGNPGIIDFINGWSSGGDSMPDSLGSQNPGLMKDMKGASLLTNVVFALDFGTQSVVLEAGGKMWGADFHILVVMQRYNAKWVFGVKLTTSHLEALNGLPGIVKTAVDNVGPNELSVSAASFGAPGGGIEVQSVISGKVETVRRGLALVFVLGLDHDFVKQVRTLAPEDLKGQVESAGGAAGLTMIANLVSPHDLNLLLVLAGNVPMGGNDMVLETIAFCLRLKSTGPPAIGFLITMRFTMGDGSDEKELAASGFVALSAAGTFSIELAVGSPEPWERPFGLSGVAIIFPLGLEVGVNVVSLAPMSFGLVGGAEIGGVRGQAALGLNLEDMTKSAFRVEVYNVNFKDVFVDITGCEKCVKGIGGVLLDFGVKAFKASFNPNLVEDVVLQFADESVTIPAGIHVEVEDLNLWDVVFIDKAEFSLSASGAEMQLLARPVQWGPLSITSKTDASQGPMIHFTLSKEEQYLFVSGKAQILGFSVGLELELSDERKRGEFQLNIGKFIEVYGAMETTGSVKKGDFESTVTAYLKADFNGMIDAALAWLDDLKKKADAQLIKALQALDQVQNKLNKAQSDLNALDRRWQLKLNGWLAKVRSLDSKIKSLNSKVDKYTSKCKRRWSFGRGCAEMVMYRIERAAVVVGRSIAVASLNGIKAAARVAVLGMKGAVSLAQSAVTAAQKTLSFARKLVAGFLNLLKKVGGAFRNVLQINEIRFSSSLSTRAMKVQFSGDIVVFGKQLKWNANCELDFARIAASIGISARKQLKKVLGKAIPWL